MCEKCSKKDYSDYGKEIGMAFRSAFKRNRDYTIDTPLQAGVNLPEATFTELGYAADEISKLANQFIQESSSTVKPVIEPIKIFHREDNKFIVFGSGEARANMTIQD